MIESRLTLEDIAIITAVRIIDTALLIPLDLAISIFSENQKKKEILKECEGNLFMFDHSQAENK